MHVLADHMICQHIIAALRSWAPVGASSHCLCRLDYSPPLTTLYDHTCLLSFIACVGVDLRELHRPNYSGAFCLGVPPARLWPCVLRVWLGIGRACQVRPFLFAELPGLEDFLMAIEA